MSGMNVSKNFDFTASMVFLDSSDEDDKQRMTFDEKKLVDEVKAAIKKTAEDEKFFELEDFSVSIIADQNGKECPLSEIDKDGGDYYICVQVTASGSIDGLTYYPEDGSFDGFEENESVYILEQAVAKVLKAKGYSVGDLEVTRGGEDSMENIAEAVQEAREADWEDYCEHQAEAERNGDFDRW